MEASLTPSVLICEYYCGFLQKKKNKRSWSTDEVKGPFCTIQGGTLIKGGHYRLEKGFDRDTIQGGTLFKGGH